MNNMPKKTDSSRHEFDPADRGAGEVAQALEEVAEIAALPLGLIAHAMRARRRRSVRPRAA